MIKISWDCLQRPARAVSLAIAAALLGSAAAGAAAASGQHPPSQLTFDSPDKAGEALVAAAKAGDLSELVRILGEAGQSIVSSGDPTADKNSRDNFVAAYEAKHRIASDTPEQSTLVVGDNDWPLPIPIVKDGTAWRFDSLAGRQEILYRRVGENELDAIQVALAYVDAQREYADADPEGHGTHVYAQRLMSRPGKKDGLYWPTDAGEPQSPLGDAVAEASRQGYAPGAGAPYHGYYYKILTGQGPAAPGGEEDYIVHGKMIGGFGLVAFPAQYGNSGVMTFIVNHDGIVFQKDLGPATTVLASRIDRYNPDAGWAPAEPTPRVK